MTQTPAPWSQPLPFDINEALAREVERQAREGPAQTRIQPPQQDPIAESQEFMEWSQRAEEGLSAMASGAPGLPSTAQVQAAEEKSGGGIFGKLKSIPGVSGALDKAGDFLELPPVAKTLDVAASVIQPIEETAISVGEAILVPPVGPWQDRKWEAQNRLAGAAVTTLTQGPQAAGQQLQAANEERPLWEQIALGTLATLPLPIVGIGSAPLKVPFMAARNAARAAKIAELAGRTAPDAGDLGIFGRAAEEATGMGAPALLPAPGAAVGETVGYPLTSALKSVDEISADIQAATHPSALARVPILRDVVRAINPSALVADPDPELVSNLARYFGVDNAEAANIARKVQADLLAHTRAGSRGENLIAAVEQMINREARRVGLTAKDGVLNVPSRTGVVAALGDVFENPSQFVLNPQQSRFVDEVQLILEDALRSEKAKGVEVAELYSEEGRYFPRQVVEVRGDVRARGPIGQMPGAKQGFQQGRYYQSQAEAMAAGVKYGDNIGAAVGIRLRAGLKASFDKDLQGLLSPLMRSTTDEFPKMFAEAGVRFPAFGGKVSAEGIMNLLTEHFTRKPPSSFFSIPEMVNNFMRPLILAGDLGSTGLQLLATAYTRPVSFFKAFALGLDEIITNGKFGQAYFSNKARVIERGTRAGMIWNGTEMTFDDLRRGRMATQIINAITSHTPLGRFERGFNTMLNVAATENFEAMIGIRAIGGPQVFTRLERAVLGDIKAGADDEIAAAIANKMTGRISLKDLGYSANSRSFLSDVVLAARYQAAFIGAVGDALQGGMRGAEGRRILGHLIGGAIMTHLAMAKATGQEPNLDPRESDFLRIKFDGVYYGLGGVWYQHIRMASEIEQAIQEGRSKDIDNILARRARGLSAPVIGLLITQKMGEDYFGNDLRNWQDRVKESMPIPIAARTALKEGVGPALAQFFGGSAFPVSPYEQINDISRKAYNGKEYSELDTDQKRTIDARADVKALFAQMSESQRRQGSPEQGARDQITAFREKTFIEQQFDDDRLTKGNITFDAWQENYRARAKATHDVSDQLSQAFGIEYKDKDPKSLPPIKAALANYFNVDPDEYLDKETGKLTADFFKAQDATLAKLTSEQRAAAFAEIEKYQTPLVREYKAFNRDRSDAFDALEAQGINLEDPRDREKIRADPALSAVYDRARSSFTPSGAVGTLTGGSYADRVRQLEIEQGIPDIAKRALAGDVQALDQWGDMRGNFLTLKAGMGIGIFGELNVDPETPVGKLVQEYYDIKLTDFRDESGTADYGAYYAAQDAKLATMPKDLADAIRNRPVFDDDAAEQVDAQWRAGRELIRNAPSRYTGLEGDFADEYALFARDVNFYRPIIEEQLGRAVRPDDIARRLATERGNINLYEWYDALQSPSERDKLRNPAYDKFLADNQTILQPFHRSLYGHAQLGRMGVVPPPEQRQVQGINYTPAGIGRTSPEELGRLLPGGVSGFIDSARAGVGITPSPTSPQVPSAGVVAAAPVPPGGGLPETRAQVGPPTIPTGTAAPKIGPNARVHYTPETRNMTVYDPDTKAWHVFNFGRPTGNMNTLNGEQALALAKANGIDETLAPKDPLIEGNVTPAGEPPPQLSNDLDVQYDPKERALVVIDRGTGKRYYFNFEYPQNTSNTLAPQQAMDLWQRYVPPTGQEGTTPAQPRAFEGIEEPVITGREQVEYDPDRQVLTATDPRTGRSFYYDFRYPYSNRNTLRPEQAAQLRDQYMREYYPQDLGIFSRSVA